MAKNKPSFGQRIKNLFSRKVKNEAETISYDDFVKGIVQAREDTGTPMNLSGVYACIEIISNTVSKLPFFVMNRHTKEHVDLPELYELLNVQPNQYMNAMLFKKVFVSNILAYGNGYIYPQWRGLQLKELRLLQPDTVANYYDKGRIFYGFTLDGVDKTMRYDELAHVRAYSIDGVKGISPLTYARLTTQVGLNQEAFQKAFYQNGGRPSGVLQTATDVTMKKVKVTSADGTQKEVSMRDVLLAAWNQVNMGSGNAYKTALLDNGLTYQTIPQISPADMDFVNSKTVNLEDIARFFNVPPYKLGVGKQTYSNNEQAQIDYITNCIVPLVTQIEQELTAKLLTAEQRKAGYQIKANIEAEMRGDTATRANWYDKMRSMGVYSINDILALENLPGIGEMGDARLIGANSVPLERLLAGDSAGTATPNDINPDEEENFDDDEQ